jgi:hypothetical protein
MGHTLFATSPTSVGLLSPHSLSMPALIHGFLAGLQLTALHQAGERKDQEGLRVCELLKSVADRLGRE